MKHDIEFEVGDKVIYKPYQTECKCVVKEVRAHKNVWGNYNDKVFYRLDGEAKTETSGLSIMESKYYEQ